MDKKRKIRLFICVILGLNVVLGGAQDLIVIRPQVYTRALRNPHKGFTNRGFNEDNEWASLVHVYIRWNQIENERKRIYEKDSRRSHVVMSVCYTGPSRYQGHYIVGR